MNIKKIIAMLAASFMMTFSVLPAAYAEESEESREETVATQEEAGESEEETTAAQEEAEEVLSEDGLWTYTIQTDEETNEEHACIEKYYGNDTEIVIPDEIDGNIVRELGDYAFYENEQVTKFTISKNITDFGKFPFFGCTSLKEFEVDEKNEIYDVKDGILFGDDNQLLVCFPAGKTETEYTVPDGIVALKSGSFSCCSNLKTINFPDALERIGIYCFAECTSLNNVVIPENVSELDMFSFTGCTSLTDITLPDKMHTIGAGAFAECTSLNSIVFPKYLQEIGQAAFVSTGFTEIELPSTVQAIGYSAFGFSTDQTGQLIAMSSFTVKGVTGSYAQSYCAEEGNEHINFEAIDDEITSETEETNSAEKDKSGMKPGIIAAIVLGCGAAVAISVTMIFSARSKKSSYEPDEYDEESGNISDEDEDEDTEEEE